MNDIEKWLDSGAEVNEGLRLLSIYAPSPWTERLVTANPQRFGYLLKRKLCAVRNTRPTMSYVMEEGSGYGSTFRKSWPFLSDRACPQELKVLAADMITAWHGYVDAHEELYECASPEECLATAKKVMENYMQNRKILSEFAYYKEHGCVLGKHPVFAQSRKFSELRSATVSELFRRRKNLEGAIWRIKNLMKRGDRPDLGDERSARLEQKTMELEYVNKMIIDYEDRARNQSGR